MRRRSCARNWKDTPPLHVGIPLGSTALHARALRAARFAAIRILQSLTKPCARSGLPWVMRRIPRAYTVHEAVLSAESTYDQTQGSRGRPDRGWSGPGRRRAGITRVGGPEPEGSAAARDRVRAARPIAGAAHDAATGPAVHSRARDSQSREAHPSCQSVDRDRPPARSGGAAFHRNSSRPRLEPELRRPRQRERRAAAGHEWRRRPPPLLPDGQPVARDLQQGHGDHTPGAALWSLRRQHPVEWLRRAV